MRKAYNTHIIVGLRKDYLKIVSQTSAFYIKLIPFFMLNIQFFPLNPVMIAIHKLEMSA